MLAHSENRSGRSSESTAATTSLAAAVDHHHLRARTRPAPAGTLHTVGRDGRRRGSQSPRSSWGPPATAVNTAARSAQQVSPYDAFSTLAPVTTSPPSSRSAARPGRRNTGRGHLPPAASASSYSASSSGVGGRTTRTLPVRKESSGGAAGSGPVAPLRSADRHADRRIRRRGGRGRRGGRRRGRGGAGGWSSAGDGGEPDAGAAVLAGWGRGWCTSRLGRGRGGRRRWRDGFTAARLGRGRRGVINRGVEQRPATRNRRARGTPRTPHVYHRLRQNR